MAFVGRLAYGPNPLGVPGRTVGRAFLGRLASGPNPFGALGLGRLARGAGPGPKVPTVRSPKLLALLHLKRYIHILNPRKGLPSDRRVSEKPWIL